MKVRDAIYARRNTLHIVTLLYIDHVFHHVLSVIVRLGYKFLIILFFCLIILLFGVTVCIYIMLLLYNLVFLSNCVSFYVLHTFFNSMILFIFTGRICRRQLCRYCFYSRAYFGFFRPTGATCCTDQGEIWHGGAVRSSVSNLTLIGATCSPCGAKNPKIGP